MNRWFFLDYETMLDTALQSISFFNRSRARGRCFFIAQALCGLFLFALINPAAAAESARAKRVLMVSTGSRFSIAFPILEQNAVDKLRQIHPTDLDFY